jgi:phage tail-like protein
MADTTTLFYALAVGIEDFAGRTNPERMTLRKDMYQVLERAFGDADLDWGAVETQDRGDGVVLLVPAAGTGVSLAGSFVWALERGLAERAKQYNARHQMRFRVALAQGLCHRDSQGWLGEPMDVASRLMNSTVAQARLAAASTALLVFVVSDDFYRAVIKHGYRQIDTGAFVPLPGADLDERAWVQTPGHRDPIEAPAAPPPAGEARPPISEAQPSTGDGAAGTAEVGRPVRVAAEVVARLPGDSAVRLVADAIDDMAAPVAELIDGLPAMFTPSVAPRDILAWMRRTLGVSAPQLLTEGQSRRVLAGIVRCYLSQGTAAGLEELLRLRYGVRADVADSGGTTWSASPVTAWDAPPEPVVTVRLDTDEPLPGLDEVIRAALPLHVGYRVMRRPSS